jgi:hypothetical protein
LKGGAQLDTIRWITLTAALKKYHPKGNKSALYKDIQVI